MNKEELEELIDERFIQLELELSGYRHAILNNKEMLGLKEENQRLKDLYVRTCKYLYRIGNYELARYFQAQIGECNVFTPQELERGVN